jgi:hypothetical protein
MAAFIIIVLSAAAVVLRMTLGADPGTNTLLEFGTATLNGLSLLWLGLVLAMNEKKSHAAFGEALRGEMPTVIIALFISLVYSLISFVHLLTAPTR